ncbi:MAG: VOC family protein [Acholeplasmatales bacterium]|nr:MAG: VOC family protein [Acholeplasmatales bacterium]
MIDVIHFYKVRDLDRVRAFYGELLGLSLYKDQGLCLIYDLDSHGKIGFCTHHPENVPASTCITFVYATREDVDACYRSLNERIGPLPTPSYNTRFGIYHFFAKDFEGLTVEFQTFL